MNRDPRKLTAEPPRHLDRQYLLPETTRKHLLSELLHLRQYLISTPDSEESLKIIRETLENLAARS